MVVSIVTGATGQDGSYLCELLLSIDTYETVIGLHRRTSSNAQTRVDHLLTHPKFQFIECDLNDPMCINNILTRFSEHTDRVEVYNLAAQSHVHTSFDQPWNTFQTNALSVYGWLEAIRQSPNRDKIRFYQAGTSEMFGRVQKIPQDESTPFYPRSPYGVSKLAAYWACKNYRESYGLFIVNGILFNHESERRGDNFVTRKIVKGVCDPKCWPVRLGNLDAKRDWGHAEDYVYGMYLMMQKDTPDDYILATGETHSVREFVTQVALSIHPDAFEWRGDSLWLAEQEVVRGNDPEFTRPAEVDILIGDATKARDTLGWTPSTTFKALARRMTIHEFNRVHGTV